MRTSKSWAATTAQVTAGILVLALPLLTGCSSGPKPEEGPPPGAKLTTTGGQAPAEALSQQGTAPESGMPPPGAIGSLKGGRGGGAAPPGPPTGPSGGPGAPN